MGTGTSQGVPMIAHDWPQLDLDNPRNWRTRSSIHVIMGGTHIQVDAGPDFRMQCLQNDIREIDFFLLTHNHADHIIGMDDLRRFCTMGGRTALPVYSYPEDLERVRQIFPYAICDEPSERFYPAFNLREMPETLECEGGWIHATPMPHGDFTVVGLVFEERGTGKRAAYYTDCHLVPPHAEDLARGADIAILDALQPTPHVSHMSLPEAIEASRRIGAGKTWLTHMCFLLDEETYSRDLPENVAFAWDGLKIEV